MKIAMILNKIGLILVLIIFFTFGCSKNPMAGGDGGSTVTVATDSSINLPRKFSITSNSATETSITVNWSASVKATAYTVKYKIPAAISFTDAITTANLTGTITGLTLGQSYNVKTVSSNSLGAKESNTITVIPGVVDSAPIASNITPSGTLEDTSKIVTLQYVDTNGDLATGCTVSALSHITAQACSCDIDGQCTVQILGSSNYNGSASFQYTITANGLTSNTATSSFTIGAVNDAPTISAIAAKSTNEDTAAAAFTFTIADIDSTLTTCSSAVTGSSSNTAVIANGGIAISGSAPTCTVVLTPVTNGNGDSTITLSVSDGSLATTSSFILTVNPINDAPTISAISSQATDEDTAKTISFTVTDIDNSLSCASAVSGISSNTALVLSNATKIAVSGASTSCSIIITPVADANGVTNITLTVSDGALSATSAFQLTVNAVNDAPTFTSTIAAQIIDEDNATNTLSFTVNDIDSTLNAACSSAVSGTSSKLSAIPIANIAITGTTPNCFVKVTPPTNVNKDANNAGAAFTITLAVTDGALSTNSTFALTITPVPDITGSLTINSNLSGVASSYSGNTYGRTLKFTGLSVDESINSLEIALGTASGGIDIAAWVAGTGYTSSGIAPTVALGGTYKLISGSGAAQIFTLTPSCTVTQNYFYSVRVTNAYAKTAIVSTPAWSFWEPTCLTTAVLKQWLDASETATITKPGNAVSAWNDKSGNNNHMGPGVAPIYSATGLSASLPGITFNGSEYLIRNSFIFAQNAASMMAIVKGAPSQNGYLITEGNSSTANSLKGYYSPLVNGTVDNITGRISNNDGTVLAFDKPVTSTPFLDNSIRMVMANDTGASFSTYSNGTIQNELVTNYMRNATNNPTVNKYCLGARLRKGVIGNGISSTVSEVYITSGVLGTADRVKLEGYSAHKWGVSSNLPSGHVYINYPP